MKKLLLLLLVLLVFISSPAFAKDLTLKIGVDSDPECIDPHAQLSGSVLQFSHMAFDPLIRWNKDMKFEGRLAEKWEQISPTTYRFYLRKGVKFHSGNLFTAKDVVWTIARLKRSQEFKGLFELFGDAKAVDDYTVDIITKKPYPLVLNLATYIFPMDSVFYTGTDDKGKSKDIIEKVDYSFANTHVSGTGPFKLVSREQGVKVVMERFADYWDKKTGNVQKLIIVPIKEESSRVNALLSGDVNFIMPVPPQEYERLQKAKGISLVTMGGSRIITIELNEKRKPEFADKRVRLAIDYAINNEAIAKKIMRGAGVAAGQLAPAGMAGNDPSLKPRYNLEKAKELMKEAGLEKGFECTMIAPNNRYIKDEEIAKAIGTMLAKINIKVTLKTMPKAQYWPEFDKQVADIQMVGWHPDTEDTANNLEYLVVTPNATTGMGQYNSGNYANPAVDALIVESYQETDASKRAAILRKAAKLVYEDAGIIPIHWQGLSWASKNNMDTKNIINIMNFPYFGDLIIK